MWYLISTKSITLFLELIWKFCFTLNIYVFPVMFEFKHILLLLYAVVNLLIFLDKIDENLEALIDLANMAKELSSDSQTETKSDSSTVISSATVTTLPSAVTSPSTSSSQSVQPVPTETVPTESIRMPLPAEVKVKKENESSDPCLIIDNANDGEVSLGSDSAFNNNPSVETFTPLNIANSGSFPGDTASTSFDSATVQVGLFL